MPAMTEEEGGWLLGRFLDLIGKINSENHWQAIESAPKDGRAILVHGGVALWYVGDNCDGAWYSITGHDYPGRPIEWPVTHWMPLPSPPSLHPPASAVSPTQHERVREVWERCALWTLKDDPKRLIDWIQDVLEPFMKSSAVSPREEPKKERTMETSKPFILLKADDVRASYKPSTKMIHIGECEFDEEHARRLVSDIEELLPPIAHSCAWKDAIIDACIVDFILTAEHENDPRRAVNDLLWWQQKIALNPAVSEEAAKLHARIAELERQASVPLSPEGQEKKK